MERSFSRVASRSEGTPHGTPLLKIRATGIVAKQVPCDTILKELLWWSLDQ